jgi:hypothetical protein
MKFLNFFKKKKDSENSKEAWNFFNKFKFNFEWNRLFASKRIKFISVSLASIVLIAISVFVGWKYFKNQNDSFLMLQNANQEELSKMLDKKLSVTQDQIREYIDQKFESSTKELASLKEIDKKLDSKLAENKNEIKEYIDQNLHDNQDDYYQDPSNKTSSEGVDDSYLKNLDQKLSVTQEKITKYIDEKLQHIDQKIDSLKEVEKKRNGIDGVIKEEVKNQMATLQEARIKQMVRQQYKEKRRKLIKKMLEDEKDL